jgi:hypothetical protein
MGWAIAVGMGEATAAADCCDCMLFVAAEGGLVVLAARLPLACPSL